MGEIIGVVFPDAPPTHADPLKNLYVGGVFVSESGSKNSSGMVYPSYHDPFDHTC
jgi:hypothetical protein